MAGPAQRSIDPSADRVSRGGTREPKVYDPPPPWAGSVAVSQDSEHKLLLELAQEAFTKQVAKRVRPLSRGYVERWMKGEFWLYPDVVRRHTTELRFYKPVVLEVLQATSVDEMLEICRRTRPDLTYLWHDPAARSRLAREVEEAIKAVGDL